MAKEKTIRPEDKKVVSLWLDDYENIFSDFDPRPFSQRALSDDFLIEAKKVAHEYKTGEFDITLLVPAGKRDIPMEKIIRGRLHSYFKKKEHQISEECKETTRKGIVFTIIGIICMITATFFLYLGSANFFMSLIIVILEPAGWFLAWNGMDHILFTSNANRSERDFAKKMSHAETVFDSYSNR